ncbi:MAG: hypothetical protein E6344_03520 [Clostridium sp.]|nr:hypothetical protein [Clostridium sp.]MDU7082731.1 hypothetical protein [Clostridium sp.]
MKLIKKDWMYDFKAAGYIIGVALAGISMIFLVVSSMVPESRLFFKEGYEQLYTMVSGIISMYPIWAFAAISPQIKNGKVYLNTTNLPFSKKHLFFKGLKPWFIFCPIIILASAVVMALLSEQTESFGILVLFSLVRPALVCVFMILMNMQVIAGMIFCSAKQIKWYKVIISMVIFNAILIGVCVLAGLALPIDTDNSMWFAAGVVLTLLLGSLGVFLVAWKDVERIHQ